MKKRLQELIQKMPPSAKTPATQVPDSTTDTRRDFFKKATLGGLSLGMMLDGKPDAEMEFLTQRVKRDSKPADLKITDLRVATIVGAPMTCPILRIDTNQGLVGWGEIRDGASPNYALMLKSRLLGENPCNVERLFKKIKQFGTASRGAGGVCGVEMALWDLAGKAYNVPAYQLLGGKYRDEVRIYADTPEVNTPAEFAKKMKEERLDKGFTFLKMDFGIQQVADIPGALIGAKGWDVKRQWSTNATKLGSYGQTRHPFTGIQITDKGLEALAEYAHQVREAIGYEVPLAADHFGHFDVNAAIRFGNAIEKYQLAFMEDLIPWFYTDKWRQITDAINTPTLTGEDIYLKEDFIKLIDAHAVDMIHPDLASSGGLLETKKIGDYAEERGIPMAMHFAGTPIAYLASVHCAAATENFIALEHHSVDVPWWESLAKTSKPLVVNGFAPVPDAPGLGLEMVEEVIKAHLKPGTKLFAPTPEWNTKDSADREWS
jgi:L-alanine-DL-glutamate epimerase-like enolase superfamily enzyme